MKPELDLLNRQIIVCLQQDGRRTFASFASELHVAESTVRTRVNKLTESGILKFFGDIDPYPVGLTYAHVMIRVRAARRYPALTSITRSPGIDCPGNYFICICWGHCQRMGISCLLIVVLT